MMPMMVRGATGGFNKVGVWQVQVNLEGDIRCRMSFSLTASVIFATEK
jgi:hypothetical protein